MGNPESKVEDHLVDGTRRRGGWCAKMIDAGRRGAPDRECRFPAGVLIYVETKCERGKLAPWQEDYHKKLRVLGFAVLVLWTIAQVDVFFSDYDRGVYG